MKENDEISVYKYQSLDGKEGRGIDYDVFYSKMLSLSIDIQLFNPKSLYHKVTNFFYSDQK